ncbi:FAD binding domain of DNA photolyase-domain-containing protein [Auriculariales sp. MPI-PUGE-AT-0066]|nr:FAD binding domain of DNA photolyase-domain-containing protein [Auriculariales sp. MPI-PUGE-AT-0066]
MTRKRRAATQAVLTSTSKPGWPTKKPRVSSPQPHYAGARVATAEDAARVDADPPLQLLENAMTEQQVREPRVKGDCVVYWMRMEDLRVFDNRALSQASNLAEKHSLPLVALFIHSPGDYTAHDRGARKIDFVLRNLKVLKRSFDALNIPLVTLSHAPRTTLPTKVLFLAREWRAGAVFANIEYEVDELRRDIRVLSLLRDEGIDCTFVHDRCVVPPGLLHTQQGKQFAVYSPWLRQWIAYVHSHPETLEQAPDPKKNDAAVREDGHALAHLFKNQPVDVLEGFECSDATKMTELWPAGTEAAVKIIEGFRNSDSRTSELGAVDPLRIQPGTFVQGSGDKGRLESYEDHRDRVDLNSTSRISPYLAIGAIPTRALIRKVMDHTGDKRMVAARGSGPGVWVMELGWRDFYTHVLAAFPRVSMGRPFQEKYADVRWEANDKHLQAWKDGLTGFPIIDAAMRQLREHGWMHNRLRMTVAMFLTKDLMIDWHLGEGHFSQLLIDHDLSSNNGGWQWSASCGTDPQPYFRIFNPYLQSEKADPNGDFIRHYVPELKHLEGKAIHDPSKHLTSEAFKKLGYPRPLVEHLKVKDRVIRRFANPGQS